MYVNDSKRNPSGFLVKQRAFLKLYMLKYTEEKRLYGLKIKEDLQEEFKYYGYRPNLSEIYKALHELVEDGILEQVKVKKEGSKFQEVVYYRFTPDSKGKVETYRKQLKMELDRCLGLIRKALKDNYS